ncbi:DsrE family protein [Emcibacter sp. SYSU 3D8]|uniref:DsrE/DsrF/TusD sulfur relay family protein n=1 Tax=Emcibacter sp. SYSU 3D8 TaxID=3133969 RepID=UPI0031FE5349
MKVLFILNDPPYGTERCYNGVRLANAMVRKDPAAEITVFLMADAVGCARKGQKTPEGYYNLEHMLTRFTTGEHTLLLCGMCMDARGLAIDDVIAGARRSSMEELAAATLEADKVLVF